MGGIRSVFFRTGAWIWAAPSRFRTTVLAAAIAAACTVAAAGASQAPTPEEARRGAARAQPCAECHGAPGRAPLPDTPTLAGQQAEFLVAQMFFMREGLREVPQMAGMLKAFTDPDLTDVAAYFALQTPPDIQTRPDPKLYALGERISVSMGCGSCHHADYRGQRQVPRLTNLHEDFLFSTMKAYRENRRVGTDTNMNAILARLPDNDIRALAHYLAHFLVSQAKKK